MVNRWWPEGFRSAFPALAAALPLLLVAATPAPARAGVNRWTTQGPTASLFAPTAITAIAIDPVTPATVYAGTSTGWMFKTVTGGTTWTAINTGLTDPQVRTLAIDPAAPSTIYAGTGSLTLFKSTDAGATWHSLGVPGGVTPDPFFGSFFTALTIAAGPPTMLYAIISRATPLPRATTRPGRVFKSADGGATWTELASLPASSASSLVVDPLRPWIVYAGDAGGCQSVSRCSPGSVLKSLDGGVTWTRTPLSAYVYALAVDPRTPTTLYAGAATYFNPVTGSALGTGEWFIRRSGDLTLMRVFWGSPALGDVPVPADYDGDGTADIGVYRASTGEWFTRPLMVP